MKIRLTPRALQEAKRIRAWWQKNRPSAPELFDEELTVAIDQIGRMPTSGVPYTASFGEAIRRVLLPKTENHLYYVVRSDDLVILSIWGAPRRRGPKL